MHHITPPPSPPPSPPPPSPSRQPRHNITNAPLQRQLTWFFLNLDNADYYIAYLLNPISLTETLLSTEYIPRLQIRTSRIAHHTITHYTSHTVNLICPSSSYCVDVEARKLRSGDWTRPATVYFLLQIPPSSPPATLLLHTTFPSPAIFPAIATKPIHAKEKKEHTFIQLLRTAL